MYSGINFLFLSQEWYKKVHSFATLTTCQDIVKGHLYDPDEAQLKEGARASVYHGVRFKAYPDWN